MTAVSTMLEEKLAKLIWETSHADEGTISATGAHVIARAVTASLEGALKVLESERPIPSATQQREVLARLNAIGRVLVNEKSWNEYVDRELKVLRGHTHD